MSDPTDKTKNFVEDENVGTVFVPDGQSPEKVVEEIQDNLQAAEPVSDDSLVVNGKIVDADPRVFQTSDKSYEIETPDGVRSDILIQAEQDRAAAHQRQEEEWLRKGSQIHEAVAAEYATPPVYGGVDDGLRTTPVAASELHDKPTLQDEIQSVLNRYSAENETGTPDFILAEYLMASLRAFNTAFKRRAEWHGVDLDQYGNSPEERLDRLDEQPKTGLEAIFTPAGLARFAELKASGAFTPKETN